MSEESEVPGIRKVLVIPPTMMQEIEEFRRTLTPIPSSSEAIRRLIRAGLEAKKERGQ